MMVLLLEEEGYPILAVADGLDAIKHVQEGRPSLVLLDVSLPHVNGDEVGARLQARYGQALPIVVVTANQDGAEYLTKPFNVDGLLTVVWRCLA